MDRSTTQIEPIVDPRYPGEGLDALNQALISVKADWLSGFRLGEEISKKRGQGLEIDGVRDYAPGDDPRLIDQRATAHSTDNWPKVREHLGEITPDLWVVTDIADRRYNFSPGYFSEQNLAFSAISALLKIADKQGFPTAVLAQGRQGSFEQKTAGSGRKNYFAGLRGLADLITSSTVKKLAAEGEKPSILSGVLQRAAKLCTESVVVVVSDFRDASNIESWNTPLRQLKRQHNDLIVVELTNTWDFNVPERAERLTTASRSTYLKGRKLNNYKARYEALAEQRQAGINEAISAVGAQHIKLSTSEPMWLTSLQAQLKQPKAA